MQLTARTWDRILFTEAELGLSAEDIAKLPWVIEKIAAVKRVRTGFELRIGPYAGSLSVRQDLQIDVSELVPGTVAACLSLSQSGRRQAPQYAGSGQRVEPTLVVARVFTDLCNDFLRSGPIKEYVRRRGAIARPRGRIDLAATARGPMARGNRAVVVCEWRQLTEDTPLNRLLLSAAVRAERVISQQREDSQLTKSLIVALAGAEFVNVPDLRVDTSSLDVAEIVGLAVALIRGVPLAITGQPSDEPMSAWINVERIFEEAVLELCRRRLGREQVSRGEDGGVMLFHSWLHEEEALAKSAEPDVVIKHGGQCLLLDAKYRRSGESPNDPELYQLIAHAVAYSATAAALVTPALRGPPAIRRLGRITTGCAIYIVSVDAASPSSIEHGINEWLDTHAGYAAGDPDVSPGPDLRKPDVVAL